MAMSTITRSIDAPFPRYHSTASRLSPNAVTDHPTSCRASRIMFRTAASSSTTSTLRGSSASGRAASGATPNSDAVDSGSNTVKVLPFPSSDCTRIAPWWLITVPYTAARPMPVPLPGSLVVKKGLEDATPGLLAHPHAGVRDRDPNVGTRREAVPGTLLVVQADLGGREHQVSASWHRVARVDGKIEQSGVQLARIACRAAGGHAPDRCGCGCACPRFGRAKRRSRAVRRARRSSRKAPCPCARTPAVGGSGSALRDAARPIMSASSRKAGSVTRAPSSSE